MSKGERTREEILTTALDLASEVGLEGLSIGSLARATDMSKSGLFAHFGSKENLQIQTLERAVEGFVRQVIEPARSAPRGRRRLEAYLELWLGWSKRENMRGGCIFVAAGTELDDVPGPVRDYLVDTQRQWISILERCILTAVDQGELRRDVDAGQMAYEIYSVYLGAHFFERLMRDPRAHDRAREALRLILESAATPDDTNTGAPARPEAGNAAPSRPVK